MVTRFIALALLCVGAAHAEPLYRWTDENGTVHFSDAPAPGAQSLPKKKLSVYQAVPVPEWSSSPNERAQPQPDIVMYGAEWCGVCKRARAWLDKHNVRYTEYDIGKSAKGKRDCQKMNAPGVPVFMVAGRRVNGFSESRFRKLIGKPAGD